MRKTDAEGKNSGSSMTRRDLLKGAGALGLGSLLGPLGFPLRALAQDPILKTMRFPLQRGPYQNNGASPWYASLPLGTPGQTLKFGMDTGSNFIWVTSTLCGDGCKHYGGQQFNYQASSSFTWIDQKPQTVNFGPWGSMIVESGQDVIGLPGGGKSKTAMYLAKEYSGSQFDQLDWDGGIGFPSGSAYVQPGVSFFFADLMNAELIDPELPYVSFTTDAGTGKGTCLLGGVDPDALDPFSWIWLSWQNYTGIPGVQYIWSTPLFQYSVGTREVAKNVMFALDSGSSEFKGDDGIMNRTLSLIKAQPHPNVTLVLGQSSDGGPGQITVPPSVYDVLIEAGPDKGKVLPQFTPLGLKDLVLVGSVLLDQFYTVFEYDAVKIAGGYFLIPVGMWLFNKPGGVPMIKKRGTVRAPAGRRKPVGPPPARRL